ncbi:MAG: hypothetical protein PHV74_09945 [Dehalococcoidia bacterium]|nr:hypothetical protein [Dehalococcoidia bacterium]
MTSIVGIICKDGVVIGADSSATFDDGQIRTMEQPTEKLEVIGSHVIVAGTGQIGLGQRFCAIVQKTWEAKGFQKSAIDVSRSLSKSTIQDFAETQARPGNYGALVAFPCERKYHLCEFSVRDFQPELKTDHLWYCSMGSAQIITDPFLAFIREIFWKDGRPEVPEAIFAATWTLDHAIKINAGGVNGPIRIAVLEKGKDSQFEARLLSDVELGEHRQNVEEAKTLLRSFRLHHQPVDQITVPPVPKR